MSRSLPLLALSAALSFVLPAVAEPPAATAPKPKTTTKPASARVAPGNVNAQTIDRIELERTEISGSRELPKVMVIVPWKHADVGELAGRPSSSLMDEILKPVDRDVLRRELAYYDALGRPVAAAATGSPVGSKGEK